METKKINAQTVYFKEFKTTLAEIGKFVKDTPDKMYEEIGKAGVKPNGTMNWIYEGTDGTPDKEFLLTLAIPIPESKPEIAANVKELKEFKCVTTNHNGAWEKLGETYESFIGGIAQSGKQMTQTCREVYHVVDFENPQNNVTEIQMEIL